MEAVTYSVPEEGLAAVEAGAAAMLVAAAGALPDLAVLELTFFAPPVVAAVAAAVGARTSLLLQACLASNSPPCVCRRWHLCAARLAAVAAGFRTAHKVFFSGFA